MSDALAHVPHHFEAPAQHRDAVRMGAWTFLVTELMLFGGLFTAYALYRFTDPGGFAAGSGRLVVPLGAANTVVLLASSLTMALAVRAEALGRARASGGWLLATIGLALAFLGVKAFEWKAEIDHGLLPGEGFALRGGPEAGAELFFTLYFVMTGAHAVHMLIGVGVLVVFAVPRLARRRAAGGLQVEVAGLYWHFVDLVWIFLFPLLYLVGRHG